jgi:hypothetical protein
MNLSAKFNATTGLIEYQLKSTPFGKACQSMLSGSK